jgi:hypothetical protein
MRKRQMMMILGRPTESTSSRGMGSKMTPRTLPDATGTKAEIQEGALEDTIEVDRMKQDEALFSRENVPEVRIESHRKPNSQFSTEPEAEGADDNADTAVAAGGYGDGEG